MSATARSTEQSPHWPSRFLRPSVRQLARRVAARIALVGPELAIEAIVFRRVKIDRQRLDAGRRRCVLRCGPGRHCQRRQQSKDSQRARHTGRLRRSVEDAPQSRTLGPSGSIAQAIFWLGGVMRPPTYRRHRPVRLAVIGIAVLAAARFAAAQAPAHAGQYEQADIEYGAQLYSGHCVVCHGERGDAMPGANLGIRPLSPCRNGPRSHERHPQRRAGHGDGAERLHGIRARRARRVLAQHEQRQPERREARRSPRAGARCSWARATAAAATASAPMGRALRRI